MSAQASGDGVQLKIAPIYDAEKEETLDVDLVVSATGYRRDAHVEMLRDTWGLLPVVEKEGKSEGWEVEGKDGEKRRMAAGRDYGVRFAEGMVQKGSGVWLQGCNEGTHGVSSFHYCL